MPVHNADIAAIFDEIADLLEIEGDNPLWSDVVLCAGEPGVRLCRGVIDQALSGAGESYSLLPFCCR